MSAFVFGLRSQLSSLCAYARARTSLNRLWCVPWDARLQGLGYYTILYSPPFVLGCPPVPFAIYLAMHGLCGILDHSGVRIEFGAGFLSYSSLDHDSHHKLFEVCYGFPMMWMDRIHGTLR